MVARPTTGRALGLEETAGDPGSNAGVGVFRLLAVRFAECMAPSDGLIVGNDPKQHVVVVVDVDLSAGGCSWLPCARDVSRHGRKLPGNAGGAAAAYRRLDYAARASKVADGFSSAMVEVAGSNLAHVDIADISQGCGGFIAAEASGPLHGPNEPRISLGHFVHA